MIQPISAEELSKFNDLLTEHLSDLTDELKTCTDAKINKLLRAEITNATSMINGLSKHKLFASNYAEVTTVPDSSDEEEEIQLKPKPRAKVAAKKDFKAAPSEPIPKVPAKKLRGSIRDALLKVH
jgi:hypothetical protein